MRFSSPLLLEPPWGGPVLHRHMTALPTWIAALTPGRPTWRPTQAPAPQVLGRQPARPLHSADQAWARNLPAARGRQEPPGCRARGDKAAA